MGDRSVADTTCGEAAEASSDPIRRLLVSRCRGQAPLRLGVHVRRQGAELRRQQVVRKVLHVRRTHNCGVHAGVGDGAHVLGGVRLPLRPEQFQPCTQYLPSASGDLQGAPACAATARRERGQRWIEAAQVPEFSCVDWKADTLDPVLARTITHAYEVVCLENRTP